MNPRGQIHAEIIWNKRTGSSSRVAIKDRNSTNGTFVNGLRLEQGALRMLRHGSEISFGPLSCVQHAYNDENNDYRFLFHHLAANPPGTDLHAQYELDAELGRGSFGIAYRARSRVTGQWYAVKIIRERRNLGHRDTSFEDKVPLQREIAIMRNLKHPNICKLHDVFIQANEIDLVLELVEGGDLLDYITQGNIASEDIARYITHQICEALAYIHDKGITHRDVKPENVLLTTTIPPQVKVTDFGLSAVTDKLKKLKSVCGTPAYLAPEVICQTLDEGYDNLVDSWSVGVVLFTMLTVANPFFGDESDPDVLGKICQRSIDWQILEDAVVSVSPGCRQFIERLLEVNPRQRMGMREALMDPWFTLAQVVAVESGVQGAINPSDPELQYQFPGPDDYLPRKSPEDGSPSFSGTGFGKSTYILRSESDSRITSATV
ncbi:hypothetical protein PM082_012415 [Marasmius tenuissimus]|nr:hypothetical protein PM082_012415 [Marasmius tenuissimus]